MRNPRLTLLSRPLVGLVSIVLIALAPAACRKEAAVPSEAYMEAHQRFIKLYGLKLDDAFLDPQMDEIDGLLQQVPADSMDAELARELQQRIKDGRARMQKARKEQEDAIASARRVDRAPSAPSSLPDTVPAPAPPPVPRDAGTAPQGPTVGSPASELVGGYLGCFESRMQVTVTGKGLRDAWQMSDRARCIQTYPGFVGQVILIEDGKVLAVLPKSGMTVNWLLSDGGATTGGPTGGK